MAETQERPVTPTRPERTVGIAGGDHVAPVDPLCVPDAPFGPGGL